MESDIKKVIRAKGFTLEQVASRMKAKDGMGISQSALSQMLNGNPSLSRVKEIARIVGVSVSELIGEEMPNGTKTGLIEFTCPHCGKDVTLKVINS